MTTATGELHASFVNAVAGSGTFNVCSDSNASMTYSWEPEPEDREKTEMRVLRLIRNNPGIRPSDIALRLMIDDSEVFDIVVRLHSEGLVGVSE